MFGTAIIIPESLSYLHIREAIKKGKPTLASLVSNQLKNFADDSFSPNRELRMVLLGGGFSDSNLVLKAISSGWNIAKVYGSTETSSFVSFMNTEEVKKNPGASGKALPPNEIIIAADGEIAVKSLSVMIGYFNNAEETSVRLKNGYYHTGDTGLIDHEGYLIVESKRDNLIVSGGENINPFEIEEAILTHHETADACVVGIKDERWGEIVSAAVILNRGSELSEEDLKKYLKERLAGFKVPKKIIFVTHLLKSGIGKVRRDKVRDFFKD
jgi:O-succinylbenzoic acid--CoA ligase